MLIFNKLGHKIKSFTSRDTDPEKAYNIWADFYDQQPDNLMLYLDELILEELLRSVSITNKKILDFGCGTGRHWSKLYQYVPEKLIGVDISNGMLDILKQKFQNASVYQIKDNLLHNIPDQSIDLIISTLTIAHIQHLDEIIAVWNRILKSGGELILTDFHPDLLKGGGKRVFSVSEKVINIRNYIHSLESIEKIAHKHELFIYKKIEKYIDESVQLFYAKQNAMHVYEKYVGYPVIYGLHLQKK